MANPSATLATTSAIHTYGRHSISHQATTSANKTLHDSGKNISHQAITSANKAKYNSGNNISHMAITSANHIHGNTNSHPGNNICKLTTTVVHLLVQLIIKVVIPTATKTNGNNICQYKHQPDGNNITICHKETGYNTSQNKTQVANSKRQHGNNICQ